MAALSRIEALAGERRYAVSFEHGDGSTQTAVVQLGEDGAAVDETSLPLDWTRESPAFAAVAAAVVAFDSARRHAPAAPALRDVEGGWDVALGNVVLGASGTPTCSAHGEMAQTADGDYLCPECGARALLS